MEYLESYGGRFGKGGQPPDRERCATTVNDSYWNHKQCPRKANSDPDDNGKPTACGVHSEARKAARLEKQREKWKADGIRSVRNSDIDAVNRVIGLVERRNLSVAGWGAARTALDAILKDLQDA